MSDETWGKLMVVFTITFLLIVLIPLVANLYIDSYGHIMEKLKEVGNCQCTKWELNE